VFDESFREAYAVRERDLTKEKVGKHLVDFIEPGVEQRLSREHNAQACIFKFAKHRVSAVEVPVLSFI
jgi:hypothetical protein